MRTAIWAGRGVADLANYEPAGVTAGLRLAPRAVRGAVSRAGAARKPRPGPRRWVGGIECERFPHRRSSRRTARRRRPVAKEGSRRQRTRAGHRHRRHQVARGPALRCNTLRALQYLPQREGHHLPRAGGVTLGSRVLDAAAAAGHAHSSPRPIASWASTSRRASGTPDASPASAAWQPALRAGGRPALPFADASFASCSRMRSSSTSPTRRATSANWRALGGGRMCSRRRRAVVCRQHLPRLKVPCRSTCWWAAGGVHLRPPRRAPWLLQGPSTELLHRARAAGPAQGRRSAREGARAPPASIGGPGCRSRKRCS